MLIREACEEYAEEVEKLAYKLMELIAMSLGLVPNRFRDLFIHNTSNIRLNHYPPCPYPHLALGLGRHKDTGVLTVLAQDDVGGLQVKRKSDGEWIQVKPIFNSFIINVGDMIQVPNHSSFFSPYLILHLLKITNLLLLTYNNNNNNKTNTNFNAHF
jgi:isopenicillin N synthase-like dioxygenase